MNLGLYNNGFTPGELVTINMPCASFDGMETKVLHPRPMDTLAADEVLVRNPVDQAWVLRLHKGFLLKAGESGCPEAFAAAPASVGVLIR